jgi:uncharacterized short protein YbdD (DUF466 family)
MTHYNLKDVKTEIISVSDYKSSGNHSEIDRIIHNMTPQEKAEYFKFHKDTRKKSKISDWKSWEKPFESAVNDLMNKRNQHFLIKEKLIAYMMNLYELDREVIVGIIDYDNYVDEESGNKYNEL